MTSQLTINVAEHIKEKKKKAISWCEIDSGLICDFCLEVR